MQPPITDLRQSATQDYIEIKFHLNNSQLIPGFLSHFHQFSNSISKNYNITAILI